MFANYLKLAFRNLWRRKFFSAINILGLAIGLACCLLIYFYITDELSYDKFHEAHDSIYRVNWDFKWNNNEGIGSGTPPPLAKKLSEKKKAPRTKRPWAWGVPLSWYEAAAPCRSPST